MCLSHTFSCQRHYHCYCHHHCHCHCHSHCHCQRHCHCQMVRIRFDVYHRRVSIPSILCLARHTRLETPQTDVKFKLHPSERFEGRVHALFAYTKLVLEKHRGDDKLATLKKYFLFSFFSLRLMLSENAHHFSQSFVYYLFNLC